MLWHDKHQQYGVRLSHPACEARPENELSWAARTGNIRMMKRLMAEHGSKLVNAHNWSGYAPLHYSIMEDSPFVFDFLITSGADVNLPIRALACKFEPLYYAVSRDRPYFCRVLLEHGANNDKVDAMGNYYLHYAAFHGQRTVCDVLLDTDAPWSTPVDARNSHGETPLLWAVRHGRVEVCRLLLGRGADWEAVADYGCCVGDFATDPEVIALIEKKRSLRDRTRFLYVRELSNCYMDPDGAPQQPQHLHDDSDHKQQRQQQQGGGGEGGGAAVIRRERDNLNVNLLARLCPDIARATLDFL